MVSLYLRVASTANRLLMIFPLTWLCEAGFLALHGVKNNARTKVIVKPDQMCALPTTGPRLGKVLPRCNKSHLTNNTLYRRDGVVVRASASQSVDLGFFP